jgi:branched-chain amino acid transport system ATP-binding protein
VVHGDDDGAANDRELGRHRHGHLRVPDTEHDVMTHPSHDAIDRSAADGSMFELRNLTVAYDRVVAVQDVSLHVDRGEIVALLGGNGAGKSTTVQSIVGWARPTAGRIMFEDRDLTGARTEDVVRSGITLVPQGRQVFSRLTVRENLRLGALARAGRPLLLESTEGLLDLFPILGQRADQAAGDLSGGEQQQLVIARALMSSPRFIMFDEPSIGLAPKIATHIFDLIRRLRDLGLTVLVIEQNVSLALDICDRAYVLREGEVRLTGAPDEIQASPELEALFLGARRSVA